MRTTLRWVKCPKCGRKTNNIWFERANDLYAFFIAECYGDRSYRTQRPISGWHIFRVKVRLVEAPEVVG